MATTNVVKVKVLELSKYGFKDEVGYVSWSKKFSEDDKAGVVPGAAFEAEYYVSDTGTRYLNKIVAIPKAASPAVKPAVSDVNPPVDGELAKRFTPTFNKAKAPDNTMSKDEWAAKDIRISRQGCIQAAVNSLGAVLGPDTLFVEAQKLADQMLEYVNRR